jgi:hypothetical protein
MTTDNYSTIVQHGIVCSWSFALDSLDNSTFRLRGMFKTSDIESILTKVSYYMPLMAKNAGVVSTKQQLLLNALQSPVMTVATLVGVRFIDKAGKDDIFNCEANF